jgi:hypothetical protein
MNDIGDDGTRKVYGLAADVTAESMAGEKEDRPKRRRGCTRC